MKNEIQYDMETTAIIWDKQANWFYFNILVSCNGDGDCPPGKYCINGACQGKSANMYSRDVNNIFLGLKIGFNLSNL